MRQLALKALVFALPLLLAGGYLEFRLRSMPSSYLLKQALLEKRAAEAEVLVIGASEALQGMDPAFFGRPGLNLANVGQDFYYDRELLKLWLPRMPKLRLVLIPVSYPGLEYRLPGSPEAWRSAFYRLFMGLPAEDPASAHDLRNFSALLLYEPLPALKYAWGGFKGDAPAMTELGFQGLKEVEADEVELKINAITGRKRVAYHHGIMKAEAFEGNLAQLEGTLDLLKSRGVRAALLTPPVSEAYASAVDPLRRARAIKAVSELAARRGVLYRDYFQDKRLKPEDFNDSDHLAAKGAARFSAFVAAEIIRKELR